jgi:hypothetical protein
LLVSPLPSQSSPLRRDSQGLRVCEFPENAFPGLSSLDLSLLSRVFRFRRRCSLFLPVRAATASFAVSFPFDVFLVGGSHLSPKGYHPLGYVASSAFHTLSRSFSALYLPALFHAGPVLGVSPFRVLRRSLSIPLFRASLPSCGLQILLPAVSVGLNSWAFLGVPFFEPTIFLIRRSEVPVPLQGFSPRERLFFPPKLFICNGNPRPSWAFSS